MDTVYVSTINELKDAVNKKRDRIVVRGKLANKLKLLSKIKKTPNVHTGMSKIQLGGALFTVTGVTAAVWITLIITVGVVVIVALIRDYNAKVKIGDNEVVIDKK